VSVQRPICDLVLSKKKKKEEKEKEKEKEKGVQGNIWRDG
jgi:hypothetical protein